MKKTLSSSERASSSRTTAETQKRFVVPRGSVDHWSEAMTKAQTLQNAHGACLPQSHPPVQPLALDELPCEKEGWSAGVSAVVVPSVFVDPIKGLTQEVLDSFTHEVRVLVDIDELHQPLTSGHAREWMGVQEFLRVRVCAGGGGQPPSLPRQILTGSMMSCSKVNKIAEALWIFNSIRQDHLDVTQLSQELWPICQKGLKLRILAQCLVHRLQKFSQSEI